MSDNAESRGQQMLLEIATVVTEQLIADGIAPERARKIALQSAERLRQHFGGERIYIPTGLALLLTERDRQIWREFTGRNTLALAKKFKLTPRRIDAIIARVRQEEFESRQMRMFG